MSFSKPRDNDWMDRLLLLDKLHSKDSGLDINEAEKILKNLEHYISMPNACPLDQMKIANCYKMNRGNTLLCNAEVNRFISCVNQMFHNSVHTNLGVSSSKKFI